MKRTLVWTMPVLALCLMVSSKTGVADSSDVKVPGAVDRGQIRQALQR